MNTIYTILAQAGDAASSATTEQAAQGGSFLQSPIVIMLLFLGAMYFFMIAPQRKRQKQHEQMLNNLQTGDEIITIGGIYGKITNKTDKTFTIKVADSTKIEILKNAVSSKVENPAGTEASKTEEIKK